MPETTTHTTDTSFRYSLYYQHIYPYYLYYQLFIHNIFIVNTVTDIQFIIDSVTDLLLLTFLKIFYSVSVFYSYSIFLSKLLLAIIITKTRPLTHWAMVCLLQSTNLQSSHQKNISNCPLKMYFSKQLFMLTILVLMLDSDQNIFSLTWNGQSNPF